METRITQDEVGTHIDWSHDGVTPSMIDWFWSNLEKGFLLWHPAGVVGKSSAIGARKMETHADGLVWSAHCIEEIGNWGTFLPQLYTLFKVVKNPSYNPFADLSVDGKGREARYRYIACTAKPRMSLRETGNGPAPGVRGGARSGAFVIQCRITRRFPWLP